MSGAAPAFSDLPRPVLPMRSMEPDWKVNGSVLKRIDVSSGPLFKVSEVASFFFAKSAHWIRWKEKRGDITETREGDVARSYNLRDVERMAHELCRCGAITPEHLKNVIRLVYIEAHVWGYLPS